MCSCAPSSHRYSEPLKSHGISPTSKVTIGRSLNYFSSVRFQVLTAAIMAVAALLVCVV
jgi:hypothetical protein